MGAWSLGGLEPGRPGPWGAWGLGAWGLGAWGGLRPRAGAWGPGEKGGAGALGLGAWSLLGAENLGTSLRPRGAWSLLGACSLEGCLGVWAGAWGCGASNSIFFKNVNYV